MIIREGENYASTNDSILVCTFYYWASKFLLIGDKVSSIQNPLSEIKIKFLNFSLQLQYCP